MMNPLKERLMYLENRIAKIPDPFILLYRPPGKDYQKINVVLDDIHERLNRLEDALKTHGVSIEER